MKLLLLLVVVVCVYGFPRELLTISQPYNLSSLYPASGIPQDHLSPAMFGIPSYRRDLVGQVFYADPSDACSPIQPSDSWVTGPGNALILLVDRGNCTFVTKVRNAQNAGALAVIVADSTDYPNYPYRPPLMADDGKGQFVSIPSILIVKTDGDRMRNFVLSRQPVLVTLMWNLPNPDGTVEWDLWTSATDDQSRDFKRTFGKVARALGAASLFTPHYYIVDGTKNGCLNNPSCFKQCTNRGRYCNKDPAAAPGVDGAAVVTENLRQICIWQTVNASGHPYQWFDYVAAFDARCNRSQSEFNGMCSQAVQTLVGFSSATRDKISACVQDSGGADPEMSTQNTLLEAQLASMRYYGIFFLPTLVINQVIYWGGTQCAVLPDGIIDTTRCGVLDAICAGLKDSTHTPACMTDAGCDIGTQRDECGTCGGDGKKDFCGACLSVHSPSFNKSCAGCDGVPNSGLKTDPCGVCGGTNSLESCTAEGGVKISTVIMIGGAVLVVVGIGVFCYMRRKEQRMKLDIDKLLQQYLPLEQANTMRQAQATNGNGQHATPEDERLVGTGHTDSST